MTTVPQPIKLVEMDEIVLASHLLWQINQNSFWWSTPGLGKTQTHLAIEKILKLHMEILVGSARLPEDISGYPYPDIKENVMRRLCDTWVRRTLEAKAKKQQSMLLLDDFSTVNEAMESAFYRVVQEKVSGDENLEGVWISACGNPPGTAAGARPLSFAMANRFCHFEIKFNPTSWARRRRLNFPLPELRTIDKTWEELLPKWSAAIGTFCERFDTRVVELHNKAGKREDGNILGYPSERSLDNLGHALAACEKHFQGTPQFAAVQRLLGVGIIGSLCWEDFTTFIKEADIPDPEDFLDQALRNGRIRFPDRDDIVHMVLNGVVQAVVRRNSEDRWRAALKIHAAAPKDVAAVTFMDLYNNTPKGFLIANDPLSLTMIGEFEDLIPKDVK